MDPFREDAIRLLAALGVGLLLGLERERHKGEGATRAAAGIRTFALASLLGAVADAVGNVPLVAVGGAFVGGAALAGYLRSDRSDPGLTTEVALVLAYFLGVCAMHLPAVAVAIGVSATALLAFRTRLHAFARTAVSESEILDGLLLGIAALVVLPVLPDRALGPLQAVNPARVGKLAVLVMAVGLASHFAVRFLGTHAGLPMAGFAGGFVSSTATLGSMGALAKRNAQALPAATAAAVLASVSSLLQVALVIGVTSLPLLRMLRWPLIAAAAAATVWGVAFTVRRPRAEAATALEMKSVDLLGALAFAGAIGVVMLGVALLRQAFGEAGFLVGVIGAGAADVHAAAISAADAAGRAAIAPDRAALAVLGAITANSCAKAVLAFVAGPPAFAVRVASGLALLVGAAWAGWAGVARAVLTN